MATDDDNKDMRGLHIVVIDGIQAKIEYAQVFDTYKSSEKLDQFIDGFEKSQYQIVIAACKDDCVKKLSRKAKLWLAGMGSREIAHLKYRCGFAFCGLMNY